MKRSKENVPIACYACGKPITIGQRFIVRTEGSFHARYACLGADPDAYATQILTAQTG